MAKAAVVTKTKSTGGVPSSPPQKQKTTALTGVVRDSRGRFIPGGAKANPDPSAAGKLSSVKTVHLSRLIHQLVADDAMAAMKQWNHTAQAEGYVNWIDRLYNQSKSDRELALSFIKFLMPREHVSVQALKQQSDGNGGGLLALITATHSTGGSDENASMQT